MSIPLPVHVGTSSTSTNDDGGALWSGFYKKTLRERQDLLRRVYPHLFPSSPAAASAAASSAADQGAFPVRGLDERIADTMVENCIGSMGLPLGLGLNVVMDGKAYVVPMAVEEPSVVAAASNAAKTLQAAVGGGFWADCCARNVMIGQIQLLDVPDLDAAERALVDANDALVALGNEYCTSMRQRGGGVIATFVRRIHPAPVMLQQRPTLAAHLHNSRSGISSTQQQQVRKPYLVLHVHVDVCEAMGANVINTVVEGVSSHVAQLANGRVGLRILSNLAQERKAKSSFRIDTSKLAYKGFTGTQLAARIVEAYQFANDDPFRAATSNKGVMNGIDAVALALGQDWRAIESAAHAYTSLLQGGRYGSMTHYWIEREGDGIEFLCGVLELPMAVATRGGVLQTNPSYQFLMGLMGTPSAQTLAKLMVTVGLAQNFGALRALATEGIQRGHMSLHARKQPGVAVDPPNKL